MNRLTRTAKLNRSMESKGKEAQLVSVCVLCEALSPIALAVTQWAKAHSQVK